MALLTEIANYLASTGIGTVGSTIFISMLPTEAADQCVVLTEYGGMGTEKTVAMGVGGAKVEYPRFQLMVRSNVLTTTGYYSAAKTLAQNAFNKLDGFVGTMSGGTYFWIAGLQNPFSIGLDEGNERMMIVSNFQAARQPGA